MTPDEARDLIARSSEQDEYAYAEVVGSVLDAANKCRWLPWQRQRSIALFQVVADLDIDDYRIDSVVYNNPRDQS